MSIVKEFKDFAVKGDAVDMAVGIVIGAAFGKIVNSLVNDVIMPPIGMLIGGVDFKNLVITMKEATATQPAVTLKYGMFINNVIDFLIVACAIFLVVRSITALKKKQA
jgi:large conductance mechanosensitive channel